LTQPAPAEHHLDQSGLCPPATPGGEDGGTTAPPAEKGLCADYPLTEAESTAKRTSGCSPRDAAHLASLMVSVIEPGKFANWIAPPMRGINGQPLDFEYVKLTPRG
jgi:hypothetical protein